jgi:GntR family transcriptional regulator/MocR family aminotransferase
MDPLFEIRLDLSARGTRQAAELLYRQLKAAILEGRLAAGAKLPVTRRSGALLGVSRNTAAEVYARLASEGHIVTRAGSGTYVAARPTRRPGATRPRPAPREAAADPRLNAFWLRPDVAAAMDFWRESTPGDTAVAAQGGIDLRPALIDPRLFPFDVFRQVSARQLRRLESRPAAYRSPQGNQGHYPLRAAITRHIALTRAIVCQPEDVLVTAGAQQAFDLLARVLVTRPQTAVAIEDPGYPPMRVAFAAAGARLVPVGVDAEGLIVDQLPPETRVICVCPSHQFPLGVTMSGRRRQALVAFARRSGAVIIEDDYDGEFRYEGSPLEALRTSGAEEVVFYVGTFSKCMLPALRLGFIVAPAWAMRTLTAAKNCLDWHCPTPMQMGVARFIADGHLERHVRRMRRIYKERRALLLQLLGQQLPQWLAPIDSLYGLHIAAVARAGDDMDRVAEMLLGARVKVHALSRYYLGPRTRSGLIFGYGAVDLPQIRLAMAALRQVLVARRAPRAAEVLRSPREAV